MIVKELIEVLEVERQNDVVVFQDDRGITHEIEIVSKEEEVEVAGEIIENVTMLWAK